MLAVLIAVSAISGSVSMSANAEELIPMEEGITALTTYHQCDINRDGVVNNTDYTELTAYLRGTRYEPNYYYLDANRNGIVDWADAQYIANYLVSTTSSQYFIERIHDSATNTVTESTVAFPTMSISSPTLADSSDYSRLYSRAYYEYNSLSQVLSNYALLPSTTPINSNTSNTEAIIGDDDRYPAYDQNYTFGEISGVVYVNGGAGFIVGDHEIATAGNLVLSGSSFKSNMDVRLCDTDGTISSSALNVVEVHVPYSYRMQGTENLNYALITVEDNLSPYCHFTIGNSYNVTASNFEDVPIYVTGKPQNNHFMTAYGNITGNDNTSLLHYNTDVLLWNKGSPVYTITKSISGGQTRYDYTALAIDSGNSNSGVLLSNYHQRFYLSNGMAHHGESMS